MRGSGLAEDCIIMRFFFTLAAVVCVTACSHPLEIVGQGDISSSTGANNCSLEAQPCDNYVVGDYDVTYTAVPRAGWVFSGWENCGVQFPQCTFSLPGATVYQHWGEIAPPLRALFTQDPNFPAIQASTSWSAVAGTLTIDVTVSGITPTTVRLYPKGLDGGGVELDTAAPFSFSIDATDFEPGDHDMLVTADDGATYLSETQVITVSGCNGDHALCSRGFDQVRYATTHNAMSNAANGWYSPNQNLDVPAQLAAGVRGLMLDTYRAGYINLLGQIQVPDVDPDAAYLCHSLCVIGKQELVDGLVEIREFLDGNPGAVVTLIIESYLNHELTAAAFDAATLTPYTYQHNGGAWPTLGQMIDAGTRLVVLQNVAANPSYPWLMYVWASAFETDYAAAVPDDFSCAVNRGAPTSDLFIFNHFLTDIFGSPALAAQVNHNPVLLDRINECEALYGTPANFVTVDFVDIGDTLSTIEALNALGAF